MRVKFLDFEQPIGYFFMTVLPAEFVVKIMTVKERKDGGVQRDDSRKRITEITRYCDDPDATFPTPIILSVSSDDVSFSDDRYVEFIDKEKYAEVLDGQHRIKGLKESNKISEFSLPIVFVINATEEQKAYIFSIINSKQTRVSPSLIFDLFDIVESRGPQKTCHEIARILNSNSNSPFFNRLKMLGKGGSIYASLSQGTFVKRLLQLITKSPDDLVIRIKNKSVLEVEDVPFSKYFIEDKDEVILKIIVNIFGAVKKVFPDEWDNPKEFILSKAIGYSAIMLAYPRIHELGLKRRDFSEDFFISVFNSFKANLDKKDLRLISENFNASEASVRSLAKLIEDSIPKS